MNADVISNVLWIAGTGGLVYWMMRGGGCGGHAHGGGGHQHGNHHDEARPNAASGPTDTPAAPTHEQPTAGIVDPVCGMPVQRVAPELQRSYGGKTFHFCSQTCMQKFDADPEKYARGAKVEGTHQHSHHC